VLAFLRQPHDADRFRGDHDTGPRWRVEEQHRVERVAVGRKRAWDKAPIVRITNAELKRPLENEHPQLGIKSKLDGRAFRRFDHEVERPLLIAAGEVEVVDHSGARAGKKFWRAT
jgi:hypothetical protein